MTEQGDQPWLLHLSYIKPHWPYVAPAPYAGMYRAADARPLVRGGAYRGHVVWLRVALQSGGGGADDIFSDAGVDPCRFEGSGQTGA